MRIRSTKPEFWRSGELDPRDKQSWKAFGVAPGGREFVYRLFDASHELLYVGITWNPFVRWTYHSKAKPWWGSVAYAEVWLCRDDDDARLWETRCIKEQFPAYNIHQAVRR